MKEIKNIAILKNTIMYDKKEDKNYLSKKGIIIIEDINYKRIVLDLENMVDITNNKNIEIKIKKGKTKIKYIFKND